MPGGPLWPTPSRPGSQLKLCGMASGPAYYDLSIIIITSISVSWILAHYRYYQCYCYWYYCDYHWYYLVWLLLYGQRPCPRRRSCALAMYHCISWYHIIYYNIVTTHLYIYIYIYMYVNVCMCVCMHIYIYICMHTNVHSDTRSACVYVNISYSIYIHCNIVICIKHVNAAFMHDCVCVLSTQSVHIYIYIYVYMYTYMHIYIYVYTYVYIYIYMHV